MFGILPTSPDIYYFVLELISPCVVCAEDGQSELTRILHNKWFNPQLSHPSTLQQLDVKVVPLPNIHS